MNRLLTFITTAFIILVNGSLMAQTADWIFKPDQAFLDDPNMAPYGNYANVKHTLSDPGTKEAYVLMELSDTVAFNGTNYISHGFSQDLLLAKLDDSGTIIWIRQIGDYSHELPGQLAFFNGNLLMSMSFFDSTVIDSEKYHSDKGTMLLIELDKSTGSTSSVNQLNMRGNIKTTQISFNNEIIISGTFDPNSYFGDIDLPDPYMRNDPVSEGSYVFVASLNPDKSPNWIRHSLNYGCCITPRITNSIIDPYNGDIILIGYHTSPITFDGQTLSGNGFFYSYIVCFDKNGNLRWSQKADPPENSLRTSSNVYFMDVDVTPTSVFVSGYFTSEEAIFGPYKLIKQSEVGYSTGFICKLDKSGNYKWAKQIYGQNSMVSTILCPDSNCYFAGTSSNNLSFDNVDIILGNNRTGQGFIGKIENEVYISKFMIIPSEKGYAGINSLNKHYGNFLLISGGFGQDITLGCLKDSSKHQTSFVSRLNLLNEIEAPLIIGTTEGCEGMTFEVNVENYDKNYSYEIQTSHSFESTNPIQQNYKTVIAPSFPDTLHYTVLNSNNCNWKGLSKSHTLIVKKKPSANAGSITFPETLCEGEVNFPVSVSSIEYADNYHWILPEAISQSADHTVVSETNNINLTAYSSLASDTISVYGKNICGNSDTVKTVVSVISKIPPPILAGTKLICNDGSNYTFEASVPKDLVGNYSFKWSVSDALSILETSENGSINGSEAIIKPSGPFPDISQSIFVSTSNECFTSSTTMNLIGENLAAPPSIFTDECHNFIGTDATHNFQWYFNDYPLDTASMEIHSPDSGFYKIKAFSLCDEKWSDDVFIDPVFKGNLFIPNVITPNNDFLNDIFVLDPSLIGSRITVYSRWGNKVYENSNYENSWLPTNVSSGNYYYIVEHKCLPKPLKGTLSIIK